MSHKSITRLPRDALVPMPWKNGGGVMREIASWPEGAAFDAFSCRVSVAEVAEDGPFSRFDGIDRTLVLLEGAGMRLEQADGVVHALTAPLTSLSFAGETTISAHLIDGPTADFNLMLRRGTMRGHVAFWRDGARETLDADTALLFCATGSLDVIIDDTQRHPLWARDSLRIKVPTVCVAWSQATAC